MGDYQLVVLISVAACAISFAIGWTTKSYVWPALWSALVILAPGPAFVGSFALGLLAAYLARHRRADATKERS
jgi:hypothetical protein